MQVYPRQYKLSFEEIQPVMKISEQAPVVICYMSKNEDTFQSRLSLSSIKIVPADQFPVLEKRKFNKTQVSMFHHFNMAIGLRRDMINVEPENVQETRLLFLILTHAASIIKEHHLQVEKYRYPVETTLLATSFVKTYVRIFLQFVFLMYQKQFVTWESVPELYGSSNCKERLGFVLCDNSTCVVGCGEIKPLNTPAKVIEEDRCRMAEFLKKKLHQRMIDAVEVSELQTFGVLVNGDIIELSVMKFEEKEYKYCIIKILALPTTPSTYTHMQDSISYLLGFFDEIERSINDQKSILRNSDFFASLKPYLKPTVTFDD